MIAAGKRKFAGALVALAAAVAGGCSLAPQRQQSESYDLGPPRVHAGAGPSVAATLLLPDVSAPSWLDGNGIVYRLSYDNNARPQAYANSRWVAPPAALLTQRLRSRLAAAGGIVTSADGARADYALRVELEDFSQAFSDANASRVVLRARASLVRLADRTLVAQRVFSVDGPAPTPDARGAVAALGEASDRVIENLVEWTGGQIKTPRPK